MRNLVLAAASAAAFLFAGVVEPAHAVDFKVSTATNSNTEPAAASFSTNAFVVVWRDFVDGEGARITGQRFNKAGGKVGGQFVVNDVFGLPNAPSVATFSDDSFVVVWYGWNGSKNVYAQIFDKAGAKVGNPIEVTDDAATFAGSALNVAVNGNNDFMVVWEAGSAPTISAKRFGRNGQAKGVRIDVTTGNKSANSPSIAALNNKGFVITWTVDAPNENRRAAWAQRYSQTGAKLGAAIKVPEKAVARLGASNVAALPDGGFVVAWNEYVGANLNARVQRFRANGARNGDEVKANTASLLNSPSSWNAPSIVVLANGKFVVSWDSVSGMNLDIVGQRFLANGAKSGANFTLNSIKPRMQTESSLATAGGANGFVGVWMDYDGGEKQFIFGNIFAQ